MTLVIRGKMQEDEDVNFDDENYLFDVEQYNFIINRKTCFTCDDFVADDYEKLQFVLGNLETLDPFLLEQLHYFYLERDQSNDINDEETDHGMTNEMNEPMIPLFQEGLSK